MKLILKNFSKEGYNENNSDNNHSISYDVMYKYKFHFGKACTPGNQEWSYVWFIEKDGTVNVTKENCVI